MLRCLSQQLRSRLGQRLNEKLLRSELEAIEEVVSDAKVRAISQDKAGSLVRAKTVEKAKRMVGISRRSLVNKDRVCRYHEYPVETKEEEKQFELESPSNSGSENSGKLMSARTQDLTHSEIRRVQELRERKKMFDRKIQWLKKNEILDPVRAVNKAMRRERKDAHTEWVTRLNTFDGEEERVLREELDPQMKRKVEQIEFKMERDSAVSRLRAETRKAKLANSAVANTATPNIGNIITDPLKRHLNRRRVRVAILLQQYLEEFLTCNSAQILIDHLGGAGVSVDRVAASSTRGIHKVFVRVTTEHDPKWVQERLTVLAPKLRSQLAVRVNYGYTPELEFHVLHDVDKFNKKRLLALTDSVKTDLDQKLHRHFLKQMNWK